MIILQYPLLPVLSIVCALLAAWAVHRRSMSLVVSTVVSVSMLVLAALACMLPYAELLLLLLPPLLVCLAMLTKEDAA